MEDEQGEERGNNPENQNIGSLAPGLKGLLAVLIARVSWRLR